MQVLLYKEKFYYKEKQQWNLLLLVYSRLDLVVLDITGCSPSRTIETTATTTS